MDSYDSRRMTLDPGLTILALRGLRNPDRHYPFLERQTSGRRFRKVSPAFHEGLAAWFPTARRLLFGSPR